MSIEASVSGSYGSWPVQTVMNGSVKDIMEDYTLELTIVTAYRCLPMMIVSIAVVVFT